MEQGSFIFRRAGEDLGEHLSDDLILGKCHDMRSAIRECIEASGLAIKEVAFHLGINKDHLSRMINTSDDPRHFPPEKINDLMKICGNLIPLRWMALKTGHGLYRLKSKVEEENDRLKVELEKAKEEKEMMLRLIKEIKS